MILLVPAIAITVAVVVQLNTLDLTKGRQSKCQVHKVLMSPALVDLTYGIRYDTPMDAARLALFPHADEPYDTRSCIGTPQRNARVFVCPACTKARSAWLEGNAVP